MSQFSVYANPNKDTAGAFPYLVDVQNRLLENLSTRIVIPLASSSAKNTIANLCPVIKINNQRCVLLTQQIACIPASALLTPVCSIEEQRHDILNALAFAITGI